MSTFAAIAAMIPPLLPSDILMKGQFREFVEALIARPEFGSKLALAKAIGLTDSALWRQVEGNDTLGWDSCIRLAQAAGESPRRVLELAGKKDLADLIESAFGPPSEP